MKKQTSSPKPESAFVTAIPFIVVAGILIGIGAYMLPCFQTPKTEKAALPVATPMVVTHRIVSNGEKFAGQVCVTANGWDRWYQLQPRDTYDQAKDDLRVGDANWRFDGFREVTEEQAEAIALKHQVQQLVERVNRCEANQIHWIYGDGLVVTNETGRTNTFELLHGINITNVLVQ